MDSKSFQEASKIFYSVDRCRDSIGTYSEKTLHALLKFCIEPDTSKHEIPHMGYVADILNDDGITEIQTRNLNKLRNKLQVFLPSNKVTVVYPLPAKKWLVWIDTNTGEATKKRKSPKTGNIYDAVFELYKIKMFLSHPNLRVRLMFFDTEEYRNLDGWSRDKKRGSTRSERIPIAFVGETVLSCSTEYSIFLGENLPSNFTSQDLAKYNKITRKTAQLTLNILRSLGAVTQVGKQGNAFVYEKSSITNAF